MRCRNVLSLFVGIAFLFSFVAPAPGDIISSGLIQDLDADVGVTAAGSDVSAWANQAASGGDDVVTNGGNPQLVAGPNGHSAIDVTGPAKLAGSDAAAFDSIMNGNGHTWFAVVEAGTNAGTKNAIFGTLTNSNPFSGVVAHVSGTVGNYMLRPASADFFVTGTTDISSGYHILVGRLGAGDGSINAEIFTDSPVADASGFAPILASTDSDPLTIGAERTGGSEDFDGKIARILIYDRPLSDAELNQTGFALGQAYGIQTSFVPEPSTLMLLIVGSLGMFLRFWRRRTGRVV